MGTEHILNFWKQIFYARDDKINDLHIKSFSKPLYIQYPAYSFEH